MTLLKSRTLLCVLLALICAAIGYAAAVMHTKRTAVTVAIADLWYFYEVLAVMERGEAQTARTAIAYKADQALGTIVEGDYLLVGSQHREFRSKVLARYKTFRETHLDLYKFPSSLLPPESRDEWAGRDQALSDFLKKHQ
jgi:hypothetical protein